MLTTKKQINIAFWALNPQLSRDKITCADGVRIFSRQQRDAFDRFVRNLSSAGEITNELAQTVNLCEVRTCR